MLKLWNSITAFIRKVFGNQTIQELATLGTTLALIKYPYMRDPIIKGSQRVIDAIDGNEPAIKLNYVEYIKGIFMVEFEKARLSQDQRLIGMGAIALYGPKLEAYLAKVIPYHTIGSELKKMQEIRSLAVLVNKAAGGKAA